MTVSLNFDFNFVRYLRLSREGKSKFIYLFISTSNNFSNWSNVKIYLPSRVILLLLYFTHFTHLNMEINEMLTIGITNREKLHEIINDYSPRNSNREVNQCHLKIYFSPLRWSVSIKKISWTDYDLRTLRHSITSLQLIQWIINDGSVFILNSHHYPSPAWIYYECKMKFAKHLELDILQTSINKTIYYRQTADSNIDSSAFGKWHSYRRICVTLESSKFLPKITKQSFSLRPEFIQIANHKLLASTTFIFDRNLQNYSFYQKLQNGQSHFSHN